jgi:arginyl-tRNA synthetase
MQILSLIRQRFETAMQGWVQQPSESAQRVTVARDPQHGDYQANIAMPLKNELGMPPQQIAAELVRRVHLDDLCQPSEIAGPGFINLRLRNEFLKTQLMRAVGDHRLGVQLSDNPQTFVIDYSAPNVAKPMHVGHIRSTVIGDALARILRFLGHRVITDNHLGDWGTQFGMIIYGYKHFRDANAFEQDTVTELSRLYRLIQQIIGYQDSLPKLAAAEAKLAELQTKRQAIASDTTVDEKQKKKNLAAADKAVRAAEESLESLTAKIQPVADSIELTEIARQHPQLERCCQDETVKLHEGDADNLALWNQFLPISQREIQAVYRRLDIRFDHTLGESFYHPMLAPLVKQLQSDGLAVASEGAVCIFLDGFDAPMLIRKSDGAFLYATTDIATIQYRMQHFQPDAILYVVDFRQSEHFTKLFAAARAMGYDKIQLRHVSFGTVLGPDGKPYKTRSGSVVGLEYLLDEAVDRAYQAVCDPVRLQKAGLDMTEQEKRQIAETVGMGAIKYADLSHNRTSDYEFDTEKMVALEGNTATYIQYMYARTQSILRRSGAEITLENSGDFPVQLQEPAERGLALQVLQFEDALMATIADYTPNLLTSYLYDLAKQFATFFEACPVLSADTPEVRSSRLALCWITGRVFQQGLALLGIGVIPRM